MKPTTTARDQRERPFTVVVGDAHHRQRAEQPEQGGGLEAGAAEALEQLERGRGDDHGDQHRGAGATDDERQQRDRGEDRAGDDARR